MEKYTSGTSIQIQTFFKVPREASWLHVSPCWRFDSGFISAIPYSLLIVFAAEISLQFSLVDFLQDHEAFSTVHLAHLTEQQKCSAAVFHVTDLFLASNDLSLSLTTLFLSSLTK